MLSPARIFLAVIMILSLGAAVCRAHQPRIVTGNPVIVTDPDTSRAYYDELAGAPREYLLTAPHEFTLYLNILVPAKANPSGRYAVRVYRSGSPAPVARIDPDEVPWKAYYEPYAGDTYFKGPELRIIVPAGYYRIEVAGSGDRGKYVLAVGEKESFPPGAMRAALRVIPQLKSRFFGVSPAGFLFSRIGASYFAVMLLLGMAFAFGFGAVFHRVMRSSRVMRRGRTLRMTVYLGAGIVFLAMGLFTWQPVALLFTGVFLFEMIAVFTQLRP